MSTQYGKKYPGSGGARLRPPSGGAPWYPHPRDLNEEVPVYDTIKVEHKPGVVGRLIGRKSTFTEEQVLTGWSTRRRPDAPPPGSPDMATWSPRR